MGYNDITDFSASSRKYDEDMALINEGYEASTKDLLTFSESSKNRSRIETHINKKVSNDKDFLNEKVQRAKNMNADTNATAELANRYRQRKLHEKLMYGSSKEDLTKEIVQGGLGKDIFLTMKKHGITGSAIWDTLKQLKSYAGSDNDINDLIDQLTQEQETSGTEEDEAAEETAEEDVGDFDEANDENASEEEPTEDSENDEESVQESLEEQVKALRKSLAIRNLKNQLKK